MRVLAQERVWWCPKGLAATDRHGQPIPVPVTGWEASFDNGATWKASRDNAGDPGWLISGADYPGPGDDPGGITADHTLTRSVRVLIRLRDTPETVIFDGLNLSPW